MLVKVHLLRQSGQRLSAADMRSGPGLVGWIRLYRDPGSQLDRFMRVAVLQLPDGRLLELYGAQLIQWDGRGLILSGEERTLDADSRRLERHRQAWWCKPIDARDAVPMPPPAAPVALLQDGTEIDWIGSLD